MYFGAPMFYETQKPGVRNYFDKEGFHNYVMFRPKNTRANPINKRGNREKGAAASTSLINLYVDALKGHVKTRIFACHHLLTGFHPIA